MWYIAFTLGLFGSLHCVGMCGPLAITFCNKAGNTNAQNRQSALAYNLGRTATYSILGFFLGLAGSFLLVAELQKGVSVLLGVILIISFLFNIDLDQSINQNSSIKKYYFSVKNFISNMMSKSQDYHPFQLGMANGLLPCGLVYLALAGALATGSLLGGVGFMALFGLGTLPMLFALTTGIGFFPPALRKKFKVVLPYVTLCFGIFLIYRGIVIEMPAQLTFWEALQQPIMCH